ncbi:MAG: BamA/TamA family outer membrane protein, partial [Bacteroides sp.]|nr:BamA/TamA family outer membrane protein [Bacteroides sp.]
MKAGRFIWPIISILVLGACSNTRFLADDELLYTGRAKIEIIVQEPGIETKTAKGSVKSTTDYKVNNGILGRRVLPPIGLWVHNYWNVKDSSKIGNWLFKTLSSSPVLVSEVNPDLRAQKIESELFDKGYFSTHAWSVVEKKEKNPKKARVSYFVELTPPYVYNEILFNPPQEKIDTLITQHKYNSSIKPGKQYNLEALKKTREELFTEIQNEGYFFFSPDHITLTADTSVAHASMAENLLDLAVGRRMDLPEAVLSTYKIDQILVQISKPDGNEDSTLQSSFYEDIQIVSAGMYIKPEALSRAIYFNKGEKYSYTAYQNTISRLNNLGVFSYVRVSVKQSSIDSLLNQVDVTIELTMAQNINLDIQADLVTKSTGYAGPHLLVGVSNSNTFKGAEKVSLGLTGGMEWQWGDKSGSELGTFSYDVGLTTGITVPQRLLPKSWKSAKPLMVQQTSVNLDFNLLNRIAYYRMFSSRMNVNYTWGQTRKIQYSVSPLYVNSVTLLETTPEFDSVVNENIYIRKSFEEQFIFGTRYGFTYDNTNKPKAHNFFFQTGLNLSGNLFDLIAGIGKTEDDRPYTVFNTIFSQFAKVTSEFKYYRHGMNKTLVARVFAGVGLPYGNSSVLPYVEQYFAGGAYSIRGFTARYVGPGSYHEETNGYVDQSGDMKLEANLEYRFGMSKIMKGALFIDAGN